ncbi:type II toxin-antitoxin system VapC family toxin [Microbacterium sp. NPDC012755]|uniref:type II toxin-antitoxin system VapC family toxin n=1 Tax=Microbacterium sp. NPDC012755 TaxID=3364184 RepID=UPI003695145E
MIVVDASAVVDVIIDGTAHGAAVRTAMSLDADWVMPAHGPSEAASALRGLWLARRSSDGDFRAQLTQLARFEMRLLPIAPLLPRIGELAANATVYDAAYLALAEELGVPLLTTDRKFAGVPGVRAEVQVVARE